MNAKDYKAIPLEKLYIEVCKLGILHDNSLSRYDLLALIEEFQLAQITKIKDRLALSEEKTGARLNRKSHHQEENNYEELTVEEVYEMARKKGVRHDDSMTREELIIKVKAFDKANENSPYTNPYSAANPCIPQNSSQNSILVETIHKHRDF